MCTSQTAVSYTHLDVYKRQCIDNTVNENRLTYLESKLRGVSLLLPLKQHGIRLIFRVFSNRYLCTFGCF